MATNENVRRVRVVLDGFALDKEDAKLTVHALDGSGKILQSVPVGADGTFPFDERTVGRAAKLLIGPSGAKPDAPRTFYTIPASELKRIIAEGEIAIGGKIWQPWFPIRRCVSGNVRRCFPFLARDRRPAGRSELAALPKVRKLVEIRHGAVCRSTLFADLFRHGRGLPPHLLLRAADDLRSAVRFDDIPIEVNPEVPLDPAGRPVGPSARAPAPIPRRSSVQRLVLTGGAVDRARRSHSFAPKPLPKVSAELRREFLSAIRCLVSLRRAEEGRPGLRPGRRRVQRLLAGAARLSFAAVS